jgi:two-component system, NarL family, sensor histidine kinase DegS
VKDDGKGFETNGTKAGHYGLINMRERAMKVGGQVIIDSAPGKGSQISFSVPV